MSVLDILNDINKIKESISHVKDTIFEYDDTIISDSDYITCFKKLDKAQYYLTKTYEHLADIYEFEEYK